MTKMNKNASEISGLLQADNIRLATAPFFVSAFKNDKIVF